MKDLNTKISELEAKNESLDAHIKHWKYASAILVFQEDQWTEPEDRMGGSRRTKSFSPKKARPDDLGARPSSQAEKGDK